MDLANCKGSAHIPRRGVFNVYPLFHVSERPYSPEPFSVMRHCVLCKICLCRTFLLSHQTSRNKCLNKMTDIISDNVSHYVEPVCVGHFQFYVRHDPHVPQIYRMFTSRCYGAGISHQKDPQITSTFVSNSLNCFSQGFFVPVCYENVTSEP